jgi:hypothetical protein
MRSDRYSNDKECAYSYNNTRCLKQNLHLKLDLHSRMDLRYSYARATRRFYTLSQATTRSQLLVRSDAYTTEPNNTRDWVFFPFTSLWIQHVLLPACSQCKRSSTTALSKSETNWRSLGQSLQSTKTTLQHLPLQINKISKIYSISVPESTTAVESPILSFTVARFIKECFGRPHKYRPRRPTPIAEAMIDEIISIGMSPLAWVQANVPKETLNAGLITRVRPIEDEEPNVNYYNMPFKHTRFIESISSATNELLRAIPSSSPTADNPLPEEFTLPNASCAGMYELGDQLDIMHARGVSAKDYVTQLKVSRTFWDYSLFMIYLEYSDKLPPLRHAIRDGLIVMHMMLCFDHIWNNACNNSTTHPRILLFRTQRILRDPIWFTYLRPIFAQRKRARQDFVHSLPAIEVSSIAKEDMRCPHCWSEFDEKDEYGRVDSPVHAPCSFGHVYGRSCLLELMLNMEEKMLCPFCREEWRI